MTISRIIFSAILGMGLLETTLAAADTHYVAQAGQTPVEPYTNDWPSAASNIQAAVDAAEAGDTVLVSNGVYQTGGTNITPYNSAITARVSVTKAIIVRSVNGPEHTIIKGAWDSPATTNGPSAVRCVSMSSGWLIGFTLTNGATLSKVVTDYRDVGAGGLFGGSASNCIIVGNNANGVGGWGGAGVNYATLYNCTIANNYCIGLAGGALYSDLYNCQIVKNKADYTGGGAFGNTLYNCMLVSNSAASSGGGMTAGTLYNCTLFGNSTGGGGGGANGSTLYNCTLIGNSAASSGGGVTAGILYNCIVYSNSPNNWASTTSIFTNSCTFPTQSTWVTGDGNITNNPMFIDSGSGYGASYVAGNYRLSAVSPCINAGTNQAWMTNAVDVRGKDLDGQKRIRYGTVDMGAYEYISKGTMLMFR